MTKALFFVVCFLFTATSTASSHLTPTKTLFKPETSVLTERPTVTIQITHIVFQPDQRISIVALNIQPFKLRHNAEQTELFHSAISTVKADNNSMAPSENIKPLPSTPFTNPSYNWPKQNANLQLDSYGLNSANLRESSLNYKQQVMF